jgi:DNA gyrase subunit A
MEVGLVRSVDIDREMQQAYLDYAMSVIVARALPDARDGLKPVHRRILYAMYDMGIRTDSTHKKSARIVGEVLGKYHPHGDMAVYDAMARMAQPFSMRCMLVDGQGNFGSVDGDPPAAMRYTEARLAAPAMNMLSDIQKNTVDFSDNFDGSLKEPDVLPAAIPNMLVNGSTGIAVGMSTSIPPHNLGEVVDALTFMLDNWDRLDDINVEDLMRFIKGPDFPTGGIIVHKDDQEGMTSAYGSGRGRVTVQARAHIEEMERGRTRIIVTELPFMTNKSSLIERIAELAREERVEGLADLRDESDRQGLRVVIELNKTADPEKVLQDLYSKTAMRNTFGIIMLALVDGEPRMLSLKQALRVYLDHRLLVVRRRTQYDLDKARARAHILEGLRVALKNLDEVIALIRRAPDADTARTRLMKRFRLTEIQAQAILDMALRRLAALERKKIEDEYKEVTALIKDLESLLRSPRKMRQVVVSELVAVKDAFADRRRTQIVSLKAGEASDIALTHSDLTPQNKVWISVTRSGLVSRSLDEKPPRLSGRDAPYWLVSASTRDTLYLVTEQGETAALPVHSVPEQESSSQGTPAHKLSVLGEVDRLAAVFTLPRREDRPPGWFVLTATRQGMIKKTAIEDVPGPAARTFPLVKVNEGDRLGWVRLTDGQGEVLLGTTTGMAIRFSEQDVRPMGLAAAGVSGIKLQALDEVAGMEILPPQSEVLLINSKGKAKRVSANQFPTQGRNGKGVLAWKQVRDTHLIGIAVGDPTTQVTVHLDKLAPKSMRFDEAPVQTRTAAGKSVIDLKAGDTVEDLSVLWDLAGSAAGKGLAPPIRRARSRAATTKPATGRKTATSSRSKVAPKPAPAPKAAQAQETEAPSKPVRSARSRTATKPAPASKAAQAQKTGAPAKPVRSARSRTATKPAPASKAAQAQKTGAQAKPVRSARSRTATKPDPASKAAQAQETGAPSKPARSARSRTATKPAPTSKVADEKKTAVKSTPKARLAGKARAISTPSLKPETDKTVKPARAKKQPADPAAKVTEEGPSAKPTGKKPSTRKTKPAQQPSLWDEVPNADSGE